MLRVLLPARRDAARLACLLATLSALGCGSGGKSTPPPPCGPSCQDGVALRGLRTMLKLAYNFTVAGKPVGAQDATIPCVYSTGAMGSVRVHGLATSNADQGTTSLGDTQAVPPVPMTFDFSGCRYIAPPDPDSEQNFDLTVNGAVGELGTLSQQPTAITALAITGSELHLSGTVYDPPISYDSLWNLNAVQDGSSVGACICAPADDAGVDAGADGGLACGVDAGVDCRTTGFSFN